MPTPGAPTIFGSFAAEIDDEGAGWSARWTRGYPVFDMTIAVDDTSGEVAMLVRFDTPFEVAPGVMVELRTDGVPDTAVVIFDRDGNYQRHFGIPAFGAFSAPKVFFNPAGEIVVASACSPVLGRIGLGDQLFFEPGACLLRMSNKGQHLWSKHFGPALLHGAAQTPDGGIVLSGQFWKRLEVDDGLTLTTPNEFAYFLASFAL